VDSAISPTGRFGVIPGDTAVNYSIFFVKYNTGQFFFNGELDWIHSLNRKQRWLSSASGVLPGGRSMFAPTYEEHMRFAIEMGAYAGPVKVTGLAARIDGPDRRHGIRIDRQGDMRFVSGFSNATLFKNYSLILSYTYGGGNNSVAVDSRSGYLTDVMAYGARIDYAPAANLNIFGTFFWAERLSHGYGWGFIKPAYDVDAESFTGKVVYDENANNDYLNGPPSIPDRNLGYEFNAGFNWRLLEGYAVNAAFGWWKPGQWFNYACVDRSVQGWKTPGPDNRYGTNPGRKIDPVFGTELMLNVTF
jgi:hypothetical protein